MMSVFLMVRPMWLPQQLIYTFADEAQSKNCHYKTSKSALRAFVAASESATDLITVIAMIYYCTSVEVDEQCTVAAVNNILLLFAVQTVCDKLLIALYIEHCSFPISSHSRFLS